MKTANQDQTRYKCEGFQFLDDCKKRPNGACTYSFRGCQNCKLEKCDGRRPSGTPTPRPISRITTRLPIIPPKGQKIDQMTVYVGADGTDDNVKMKICSEDNSVCCVSGTLSHLLSSEWVKGKQEKWEAGKFGKCKNQIFRVKLPLLLN